MKRSEINTIIQDARAFATAFQRALPLWSNWQIPDYVENPDVARFVKRRQMGWDITDFGSGNFAECGLTLLCLRNGIQGDASERPYAEKMLIVRELQETPFHLHKVKLEDIINCGGGNLMIEFLHATEADRASPVDVMSDGRKIRLNPHEPLRLKPGESVTVERGVYHRFYAEAGTGKSLAWEVSQVNDDFTDNYLIVSQGVV
ncbi:D-lyxose/D-mannose family sugar isomerase [Pleomorphomonas koreensis]|uniref:D-lyxose/D-mannose family sugar isomerase n=1 Tax=Pleomorphomonas koreensis TaxID=257440 RepID=UPI0003FBA443|nr:D-lyxose/D-mannose family sugar isomerase [Pleomorphomonas koreensis]